MAEKVKVGNRIKVDHPGNIFHGWPGEVKDRHDADDGVWYVCDIQDPQEPNDPVWLARNVPMREWELKVVR